MKFVVSFVATILLYSIQINAYFIPKPCPIVTQVELDLENPAVLKQQNFALVQDLWNEPFPKLSKNGKALKHAVLEMANSDDAQLQVAAMTASAWIWSQITQICRRPSLCPGTQLIDATVDFKNNGNCEVLSEAIALVGESLYDLSRYIEATSLRNAGCEFTPHRPTLPDCLKQSKYKELWDMQGSKYPQEFKEAAIALYQSNNYLDQLMGVYATATIAEAATQFFITLDLKLVHTLFRNQLTKRIPSYCCKELRANLLSLGTRLVESAPNSVIQTKIAVGCMDQPVVEG